jgi:hypothetical protein
MVPDPVGSGCRRESPSHDVNGKNATLMTSEQVIDKIANDGVWLVAELCDDPADEGSAARMPLQINRARNIPRAVDLRPTMRTSGLFGPDFDKAKFPLQLRIIHDLVAQRFATLCYHLDHRLHSRLDSAGNRSLCNVCLD